MEIYFAPMEGLTDSVYRRAHHKYFPGVDKYYMPFISPTIHRSLTEREARELPYADTEGFTAVPQLLTNRSEHFVWAARELQARGYQEVNFNLGCPSGTVTAKRKGSGLLACPEELERWTGEQYPHIRFTPLIDGLAEEIRGSETDPLRLARRVYDWICAHVQYSYVRDYLLIDNIPEFVLTNGYGDCGTMALAFITLCRRLGIPAKWQSGSSCSPDRIGSHDWSMFYVAPYGWLYCDPSYGVGSVRSGNEERRLHYFGNLDPFRLVASDEFQQETEPAKALYRMDPYDNQNGEGEYADGVHNIFFGDCTHERHVLSAEELPF